MEILSLIITLALGLMIARALKKIKDLENRTERTFIEVEKDMNILLKKLVEKDIY